MGLAVEVRLPIGSLDHWIIGHGEGRTSDLYVLASSFYIMLCVLYCILRADHTGYHDTSRLCMAAMTFIVLGFESSMELYR